MLDLTKTDLPIEHWSEGIPGIARTEKYQLGNMLYTEFYDGLSDKFLFGNITMFDHVKVCTVYPDGSISLTMPIDWVTNHKSMVQLLNDLKQLDKFLSLINHHYN